MYDVVAVTVDNPLAYFVGNKTKIEKEEIKIPVYYIRGDGSKSDEISAFTQHDCFHEVTMIIGSSATHKGVSEFSLNYKKFENGRMNINYSYNQSTALKVLISKANSAIKKLAAQ